MSDERKLPFDSVTGEEIAPKKQPGYYPGYSTLGQANYWDETTRGVVEKRVKEAPPIRFFTSEEVRVLEPMLARMVPQEDRTADRRIAILPWLDHRMFANEMGGFRYEDMPSDQEAYRLGIAAIADMARVRFGKHFAELTVHQQELLLKSVHDGEPDPQHETWKKMNVHRWWSMVMEDAASAYYAHPWAWDEIGYGGPAYPRAYMRLEGGLPEPWEEDEQRYEWNAPVDSVSGETTAITAPHHGGSHGHGGTH